MPREKTICEKEFEKWWLANFGEVDSSEAWMDFAKKSWNSAWSTCGKLIVDEIKKR